MAAIAHFEIEKMNNQENEWKARSPPACTYPYGLRRRCAERVATPGKVARRSRVKRGVCGEVKVSATRKKRVMIK